MNIYNKFISTLSLIFLTNLSFAQNAINYFPADDISLRDTVLLMNGEQIITTVMDTTVDMVKISGSSKKKKEIIIDADRIFSLKFSNGLEKVFYTQDSIVGNEYSVEDVRFFIKGEQDATKNIKTTFSTIGGFVIGAASGSFGSLLSFIPPFFYSGAIVLPRNRIKQSTVSNLDYLKYDSYIVGYERVARKKKVLNSLKSGALGLVTGLFISYQIIK